MGATQVSHAHTVNSLVAFRNSQGVEARGTLLKLSRSTLIFEVYNPYSIIQLSEVLQDVSIRRGERVIYRGRAVVSTLVNTGLMLIVSATLVDPWLDLQSTLAQGESARWEVAHFVAEWDEANQLRPGYLLTVAKLRSFLTELSRWLEQVDLTHSGDDDPAAVHALFDDVAQPLIPKLNELYGQFEQEARQVSDEERPAHIRYVQADLHPLIMRAPFVHRAFAKPLGYAGDYEMVNMMLRDPREGPSLYAQLINSLHLASGPAAAHRNRIDLLIRYLSEAAAQAASEGRELRVLNIGCGPAVEIQRFIAENPLAANCRFRLMDFNLETLDYTRAQIEAACRAAGRKPQIEYTHESVHALLKRASGEPAPLEQGYDVVYCAGLFDYLSDRVCSRLIRLFHSWRRQDGLVLVTNVHPDNSNRWTMEHLLEWHLLYRDETQMLGLVPETGRQVAYTDSTGINVFLELR